MQGLIKHRYLFSNLTTHASATFPYRFGGIPPKRNNLNIQSFVEASFGKETPEGFKEAYLAVLHALKDKDKDMLANVMSPVMTRNIQFGTY